MSEWALAVGGAVWLGILTSISPCLLTTNVAAISFLARKLGKPSHVMASGLCYTLGQAVGFVLLALVIVSSLASETAVALWLQRYLFRLLGPLLIIVSMFLFELLSLPAGKGWLKQWAMRKGEGGGFYAAALLGIVFAMSFCPTTAALFFGSLIPLAVAQGSPIVLPAFYALGVALPVMVFTTLITLAARQIARFFKAVTRAEQWARRITGWIFLVAGIYFTLAYSLRVF